MTSSSKRISTDPISKERVSKKRISRKWISTEWISNEQISNEHISKEQISKEQISTEIPNGKHVQVADEDQSHVSSSTSEFVEFEGDQWSEDDCMLIEEDETEQITEDELNFNLRNGGTRSFTYPVDGSESDDRAQDVDRVQDTSQINEDSQDQDDEMRLSKTSEMADMFVIADQQLKHLENCLQDFLDACNEPGPIEDDLEEAAEQVAKQVEQDERREPICIQID